MGQCGDERTEPRTNGRTVIAARVMGLAVWRVARIILLAYLGLLLVLMWFEETFIFVPAKHPAGDWQPAGLEFEDTWIETADGVRLHGWYVEHPSPRAVILFNHGNAGNVTNRVGILHALTRHVGASVLVYDYRGYGRSGGKPNEKGLYADARAARAWLAERAGVESDEIVLMGESLGGAVAVELAASDGCRALILDSAFTSAPDMATLLFPFIPARLLMRNRFDSIGKIGRYAGPLLQCHGTRDTIVPFTQGERLFAAAEAARPKRFMPMPGLDHNDSRPAAYYDAVREFLGQLPPRGQSAIP
ncbi:MAG: alpha/beta hydrolase [Patescibacteria group bacterium]|nr:alpha/beta hydrolase [Patescibacteria group bacterium]